MDLENVLVNSLFFCFEFKVYRNLSSGGRFGMMQAKLGIAKLVTNFEFLPNEKTTIPMEFSPTALFLAPANKMWLSVRKL
jgi:hypothetical protein